MKINILGIEYDVIEVDVIDNDYDIMGQLSIQKQNILIKNSLANSVKEHTLIHEIVHGILFQVGLYEINEDEEIVQRIATGIYQVLKENEIVKRVKKT